MTLPSPKVYLVRHGGAARTATAQHTGIDLPLTEQGESQTHELEASLAAMRILALRRIRLNAMDARHLLLDISSLSVLGYADDLGEPVFTSGMVVSND
jgi:broad specificity phosphatase PhoE